MIRLAKSFSSTRTANYITRQFKLGRSYTSSTASKSFLKVSEEVRHAVNAKKPVVALETTIYTHGFPHPQNVALAAELESIVRENGAVPATIGILDGVAHVGMTPSELQRLTDPKTDIDVLKISRRDLAFATGTRLAGRTFHGGTTIAGTSVLAHLAGIRIFATGGLGGVHRGAESSMDISADLTELGRTPITVISSGCKSFLDIPRTMEYLETEGVAVATFADGRDGSVDFPAFWARDSGVKSPMTLRDEREAAAVVYAQGGLGLNSGLLFANPIPANAAIPKSEIDVVITEAVRHAEETGITGKDNTPFILDWILKATDGRSIVANRALISSNVRRGTRVAVELAKLEVAADVGTNLGGIHTPVLNQPVVSGDPPPTTNSREGSSPLGSKAVNPEVLVAGAVAMDISCDYAPFSPSSSPEPQVHTSNPAAVGQTLGGVAFNIAKALQYLGTSTVFCSAVGDDISGKAIIKQMSFQGLDTSGVTVTAGASTAHYIAVNDQNKNLHLAMADMRICEQRHDDLVKTWKHHIDRCAANWAVLDANLAGDMLRDLANIAHTSGARVALEPVSNAKAARSIGAILSNTNSPSLWPGHIFDLAAPNSFELAAMYQKADSLGAFEDKHWFRVIDALGIPSTGMTNAFKQLMPAFLVHQGLPQQAIKLLPLIPCIIVKLGADGILLTQLLEKDDPRLNDGISAPYILGRGINDSPMFNGRAAGGVYMRHFPAIERVEDGDVVSVNGVGDTFLGTIIAGLVKSQNGKRIEDLVNVAQRAAVLTLKSKESVSPEIETLRREL